MDAPADSSHPDDASYRASGYGNQLGWGSHPALLLVDVCSAYWTPGSPLDLSSWPPAVKAVDNMVELVKAAREGEVPIIWTNIIYKEMAEVELWFQKSKMLDVWLQGDKRDLAGWLPQLVPQEGDIVVTKKYPSAFLGTDLQEKLNKLGVDTLVLCGVSTSGCVRASVLDTLCYGFRPMVGLHKALMLGSNMK